MAEVIAVNIHGHKVIIDRLKHLPDKMQAKMTTTAARKAMIPVRNDARKRAKRIDRKKTPEKIWKNIVIQNSPKTGRKHGGVAMRVGVKGGAKQYSATKENVRKGRVGKKYKTLGDASNPGGDTWYWRFVEFGIPSRGIAARPFLLPALQSQSQAVWNQLYIEMQKVLDKGVVTSGRGSLTSAPGHVL